MADTRTQWAYATLRRKIVENELSHERPYLEQALASDLGISRTPVREAALRLQEEGFVIIRPRLGIPVRAVSREDMAEIYDILTELEPYAAARLAAMPAPPAALARLEDAVAEMEVALADGDRRGWAEADRAFHRALIEEAGNARLRRIAASLFDQVHRARVATLDRRPDLDASNADHRRLIELVAAGDAAGAAALHRAHRARARAEMLSLLEALEAGRA